MKRIYLFLMLFFTSCYGSESPLVVSVIKVQDEQETIEKTLESLISGGIRDFLLYDTGSTDQTVRRARDFFESEGIKNFHIIEEAYINGAESRNRALELAATHFPGASFFLMPESGWFLECGEELLRFCDKERHSPQDAFLVRIVCGKINHHAGRLIRNPSSAHFVGEVDEMLVPSPRKKTPPNAYFTLGEKSANREKFAKRTEVEIEILEKCHKKDPFDARVVFCLAQNYLLIGNKLKGYECLKKRIQIEGDLEEKFLAMYRLAQVTESMATKEHDTWGEALDYYLKAYEMRPHRIEPLIKIAQHYLGKGDRTNAYLFAQRTLNHPYPKEDKFYIETEMYDFLRYQIISVCAYSVGEPEVGLQATFDAIRVRPYEPYLHQNLIWYNVDENGKRKPYPEQQKRELLITGSPRSGTKYSTQLFSKAGYPLEHEYLGRKGCASWMMAVEADRAPWGPPLKNLEFSHIFHQVRHPLKSIASIMTEPVESWEFIHEQLPEIQQTDSLLTKSAKLWYYWNLKAEDLAEMTYRVEDIETVFGEMEERLGTKFDRSALRKVAKNVNARSHDSVTWEELKREIEPEFFTNIKEMSTRYGYK